jgi:hypothetical protein
MADRGALRSTASSWVPLLYFYSAALISVIPILIGLIIAANGIVDLIFFDPPQGGEFSFTGLDEDRGDKLIDILKALLTAGVGVGVSWWHIREAGKREVREPRGPVTSRPITPPPPT